MCGRYTLARSQQELSERFGIRQLFLDFQARYNIAPTQELPIVLASTDGTYTMQAFRWGLIPSWTIDPKKSKALINARCETLADKKMFRSALTNRRCLVPADGFYEWKKSGSTKRPMFIHNKDKSIFAFAGIWDEWKDEEGVSLRTFSIITTEANETMAPIHNRMPVILSANSEASWLNPDIKEAATLLSFLKPSANDYLSMHEVSPLVNSVKCDSPELVEPYGGQLTLNFSF